MADNEAEVTTNEATEDRELSTLPTVTQLEMPEGTRNVKNVLTGSIDEATQHITGELDRLIQEINAMKTRVIEHSGRAKSVIIEHFTLGSEAIIFAEHIRSKLQNVMQGAEAVAKT